MTIKIPVKKMVLEAEAKIKTFSASDAMFFLENVDCIFVDLCDTHELEKEGIIPGSIHAPRGMIEFWVDPNSPYHKNVFSSGKAFVFYCKSGWRSALATKTVQDMGLYPVAHIDGGFIAWVEAENPIDIIPKNKQTST